MKNFVYHSKNFDTLGENTSKFLSSFYDKKYPVYIKIHFGEPTNPYALTPKEIVPITSALHELGLKTILIDMPVMYDSLRNSPKTYSEFVELKGWNKISDTLISKSTVKVKTKSMLIEVCKELAQAKNVLVISHVKGHGCSGFGGALKNLGMGAVSKKSKAAQHNGSKPVLKGDCIGCGTCEIYCPAKAITIKKGKFTYDSDTCLGCSICQLKCPQQCLEPKTGIFDDLLAQSASAVISKLPKKTYYINLIKDVTQFCDCHQDPGEIIAENAGVLFSENPVAIDTASIDLINKKSPDVFMKLNNKDPMLHVRAVEGIIGIPGNYKLKNI